ncbi:hypothetical protein GN958_ATG01971 [Phytophthora infestans]|uniref:Uncharacterized protein n=1 Tax=Phytophthora infestans TaxID=4787 RepID=A0A8S9V8C9_PHYIN|nr:hypothetical protein GN958_ATG01971 [Phytophthora infestans]
MKNIGEDYWDSSGATRDIRPLSYLQETPMLGGERAEREAISDNSFEVTGAGTGGDKCGLPDGM